MKFYVLLGLVIVVFLAGCTTVPSYMGITEIDELYINYENFEGKTIKTVGKYTHTLGGDQLLISDQGYKLIVNDCIEESRYYDVGSTYVAEGIVSCSQECACVTEVDYTDKQSCKDFTIESQGRTICAVDIDVAYCGDQDKLISGLQQEFGVIKRYCKDSPSIIDCRMECKAPLDKR